jgi:hypothetical protein
MKPRMIMVVIIMIKIMKFPMVIVLFPLLLSQSLKHDQTPRKHFFAKTRKNMLANSNGGI